VTSLRIPEAMPRRSASTALQPAGVDTLSVTSRDQSTPRLVWGMERRLDDSPFSVRWSYGLLAVRSKHTPPLLPLPAVLRLSSSHTLLVRGVEERSLPRRPQSPPPRQSDDHSLVNASEFDAGGRSAADTTADYSHPYDNTMVWSSAAEKKGGGEEGVPPGSTTRLEACQNPDDPVVAPTWPPATCE